MLDGLWQAWERLLDGDPEVYRAVWVSLYCATGATVLAAAVAVPVGAALGLGRFRGKGALTTLLNTLMAIPTVVIGLLCYSLLSRSGPLGMLELLYTKGAMIAGEAILAAPVLAVLTQAAFESQDRRALLTLQTLGVPRARSLRVLLGEARFGVMAGVVAGFGRAIGEVGVAMILGGNIKGFTRTMTTAIALETSKGETGVAIALGCILLAVALVANVAFRWLQAKGSAR